jgi:hypothetical protein
LISAAVAILSISAMFLRIADPVIDAPRLRWLPQTRFRKVCRSATPTYRGAPSR